MTVVTRYSQEPQRLILFLFTVQVTLQPLKLHDGRSRFEYVFCLLKLRLKLKEAERREQQTVKSYD